MEVLLASCGNPDHYQDPDQPMIGCEDNKTVEVTSLEEASLRCREFIEQNLLGSGNWAGGAVYENHKCVAKIAYNGRVIATLE